MGFGNPIGFPIPSTIWASGFAAKAVGVWLIMVSLPASPVPLYWPKRLSWGRRAFRVAFTSIPAFFKFRSAWRISGLFCQASFTASSRLIFSITSGIPIGVVGTNSTPFRFAASGFFVMATRRTVSCCNLLVCATIRFCWSVANWDSAVSTSSGAMVPISSCFLLSS